MSRSLLTVLATLLILTAALIFLSIQIASPTAVAQVDTKSPHLVSFQVDPDFVDASIDNNPYITVTIHVTDDLSGLQSHQIDFARYSPDGTAAFPTFRVSHETAFTGTATNAIMVLKDALPRYSEQGRWYLYSIFLRDRTGNYCLWRRDQAQNADPECMVKGEIPYFVNGIDNGPPPPVTPTSTPTPTPDLIATETAISEHINTAVVATLTAIARAAPPELCEVYLPSVNQVD